MGVLSRFHTRSTCLSLNSNTQIHTNLTMKVFCMLICVFASANAMCSVDSEVRFILNNFSKNAVSKNVDCVVGNGPCDSLGNKLKREYPSEWSRVVARHG